MMMKIILWLSLFGSAAAQDLSNSPADTGDVAPVELDTSQMTIRDIITNREELSVLREALDAVGILESYLDDPDVTMTVFAPNNDAIGESGHMNLMMKGVDETPVRWSFNLKAALSNHIVPNQILAEKDIFDNSKTELQSFQDTLVISQWSQQIGGAPIVTADIQATNGILHIVSKVIKPEFFDNSFAKLELQEEYGPDWLNRTSMVDVVDFVDGRGQLQIVRQSGTTYTGCRIRAFNRMGLDYLPQTINFAKNVIYGELLNASMKEHVRENFIDYQLIPRNLYLDEIPNGFQELVTPVADCAHMWVTKNNGRLCFNDGCVVSTPYPRTYLSSNGVGYVIDKCPICPGVAMMADYAAEYTIHNLRDVSQLFVGSEWNRRNLSASVGDGTPLTLFAPINTGFEFFTLEDTTRLATDKWKRHLWDLLKHFLYQGDFSKENLRQMVLDNGGPLNMTMLTGEPVLLDYDKAANVVKVGEGEIYFADVRGVDGLVHFVTEVPQPRSVAMNCYDMGKEREEFKIHTTYIDSLFLAEDIKRLLPITVFYAPNEAFEGKIFEITEISNSLLENMVFKELLWCERLVEMAGERVESHNGQTWLISVNEEGFPCFDTIEVFGGASKKACVTECDILARNGIVHKLDTVMIYQTPDTRPPSETPQQPKPTAPKDPSGEIEAPKWSRPKYDDSTETPQVESEGAQSGALALSSLVAMVAAMFLAVLI